MNYLPLINQYGAKLDDYQKPIARNLFKNLVKRGWSYEQIYWGIRLLKGRPIEKYTGLFYFDEFIKEINQKVIESQKMINISYDEKVRIIDCIVGFALNQVPEEYKEELILLDDKIFNSDYEYSKKDLEDDVNYLYEKCYLIPSFELPLEVIEEDEILHRKYLYSRAGSFRRKIP